jgi:hypothetical protein
VGAEGTPYVLSNDATFRQFFIELPHPDDMVNLASEH